MVPRCRLLRCCLTASFLIVSLMVPLVAIHAGGVPKKGQNQYPIYLKELKNRFQAWDLNNDNLLDKEELAKAFRGNKAKPFDYVVPDNSPRIEKVSYVTTKAKVRPYAMALVCLPRPGLAVNLTVAELLTRPEKIKVATKEKEKPKAPNPATLQYGDFQFLALVGGKNDKISRQEFDNWSTAYAKNLDRYHDLQQEIKDTRDKAARAKSAKTKQAESNELARHQAELKTVTAKLNAISPAIHKALNVRK